MADVDGATRPPVTWCVHNPKLPLALYREVAAHLGQIQGVQVEQIPATVERFDYTQSQVAGLVVLLPNDPIAQQQAESILAYYDDRYSTRYGSWQRQDSGDKIAK